VLIFVIFEFYFTAGAAAPPRNWSTGSIDDCWLYNSMCVRI